MKILKVFLLSFFCALNFSKAQEMNSIGAGNGLEFNGEDNYVVIGDVYDDLYPPFTISAWIYLDESVSSWAPIFASQDNSNTYKGTTFLVSKNKIGIEYGDGRGWNNPQFRRSIGASVEDITGKWIHVVGIIRDATDMDLYINGLNVGGTYSGSTSYPMVNKPGDVAKIGTWYSNSEHFWFKGKMDELRIWNYSRTKEEIRRDMCLKLKGDEPGLIGYWRFDEIAGNEVKDYSKNSFHGQLMNNTAHIVSGAAIGDESTYSYNDNLSDETVVIGDKGNDFLEIDNISQNAEAIQLYRVNTIPKDISGINAVHVTSPYYGLFICNYTSEEVEYDLNIYNNCNNSVYFRKNNSDSPWKEVESDKKEAFVIFNHSSKSEEILAPQGLTFNLGADTTLCQGQPLILKLEDPRFDDIVWNNGSTESSIEIDRSGIYWVKAHSECGISIDSIKITYNQQPTVSLGEDLIICNEEEVQFSMDSKNITKVEWQDGSTSPIFSTKSPGTYWVRVENQCGVAFDTIKVENKTYSDVVLPNVVTYNNDTRNDKFYVDAQITEAKLTIFNRWGKPIFSSDSYHNEWPSKDIPSGIYYYSLKDGCSKRKYKGYIHVLK